MLRTFRILWLIAALTASAADVPAQVVAHATSPAGTFASRPPTESYFRVLPANAELKAGEVIATLPGAACDASNGCVSLRCGADYDARSDIPILESAFVLHEAKDADFDMTLDRGRVQVANLRGDGNSTVRVSAGGETWLLTLEGQGTTVALELCGRWPAGTRFKPAMDGDAEKPAGPVLVFTLLVLKGEADVKVRGQTVALAAKPKANRIGWDSVTGPRPPEAVATLPAWADANPDADVVKFTRLVETFRGLRAETAAAATEQFLKSNDPAEQRIALVTLGANDDLASLLKTLGEARNNDQWDFVVKVLRHWIGRCAGQDQKLFDALQADSGYTPAQAQIVLQLLFGFGTEDLKQPETYEVLIDYLLHEKPAIRHLAAWHLARLVPKEKAVAFPPSPSAADCERLHEQWKRVIPSGGRP